MASERDLGSVSAKLSSPTFDQPSNSLVRVRYRAAECGPAQPRGLGTNQHDPLVRLERSQHAHLCCNMLDVKMPIEPGLQLASQCLLNCVSVWQREDNEQCRLCRLAILIERCVDVDPNLRIDRRREARLRKLR